MGERTEERKGSWDGWGSKNQVPLEKQSSPLKLAGERGKIAELGQTAFSYAKCMSFLPNYSPKFLLPHREQDWFTCQWILATGNLNCLAHHWYGHVEPSFRANGSARAGEGWSGSPLPPSVHGTSSPTHPVAFGPSTAKQRAQCQAGTTSFVLGGSNKLPASELWGDHACPPQQGGLEDRIHARGICSTCPFSCAASGSQVPHLTCNLHRSLTTAADGRNHIPSYWLGFPSHMAAPSVPARVLVLKRHA